MPHLLSCALLKVVGVTMRRARETSARAQSNYVLARAQLVCNSRLHPLLFTHWALDYGAEAEKIPQEERRPAASKRGS